MLIRTNSATCLQCFSQSILSSKYLHQYQKPTTLVISAWHPCTRVIKVHVCVHLSLLILCHKYALVKDHGEIDGLFGNVALEFENMSDVF